MCDCDCKKAGDYYSVGMADAFCCGVLEVGNFETRYVTEDNLTSAYTWNRPASDEFHTFKELLEYINEEGAGHMLHIHFVKKKGQRTYEWDGLRKLIWEQKGANHMGTFVNPNTGNTIDSYCWVAPKKKETKK